MTKKILPLGSKFNSLTVISKPFSVNGRLFYYAKCDCGKKIKISGTHLRRADATLSCGCIRKLKISGEKYGKLTAISDKGDGRWEFKCDCGSLKVISAYSVRYGSVVSCGCYNKEKSSGDNNHNWKGGRILRPDGYVMIKVPSGSYKPEHRKIMEDFLGRELLDDENVHHKNGLRDDNRIENLELWVSSQPSGQRVEDLVFWAKEVLKKYGECPIIKPT
jgi:hypothetical protein